MYKIACENETSYMIKKCKREKVPKKIAREIQNIIKGDMEKQNKH